MGYSPWGHKSQMQLSNWHFFLIMFTCFFLQLIMNSFQGRKSTFFFHFGIIICLKFKRYLLNDHSRRQSRVTNFEEKLDGFGRENIFWVQLFSEGERKASHWYNQININTINIFLAEIVYSHFWGNPNTAQRRKAIPPQIILDMTSIFFVAIPVENMSLFIL